MKIFNSLLSLFFLILVTSTTAAAQGEYRVVQWSGQPLTIVSTSATDANLTKLKEAVEIVDVKVGDLSVTLGQRFLAGDDWLRGLSFRLKNISGRPIIGARLSFGLPDWKFGGNGLGFSLEYGRGESTGIPSDEQKVVMPDEVFELTFNDRQYQRHRDFIKSHGNFTGLRKVTISHVIVKFDDETIWLGGCLRGSDPANSCKPAQP